MEMSLRIVADVGKMFPPSDVQGEGNQLLLLGAVCSPRPFEHSEYERNIR